MKNLTDAERVRKAEERKKLARSVYDDLKAKVFVPAFRKIMNQNISFEEKKKRAMELGKATTEEWERRTNLPDLLIPHHFENIGWEIYQGQQEEEIEKIPHRKELTRKEMKDRINNDGILVERSTAILAHQSIMNPSKVSIEGKLTPEKLMVLNYLAYVIWTMKNEKNEKRSPIFGTKEKLEEHSQLILSFKEGTAEIYKKEVMSVSIDPSELINKFELRKKGYTIKDITNIALDIPGIYFKGEAMVLYEREPHGRNVNILFSCAPFSEVRIMPTDETIKHTGEKKYFIQFEFCSNLALVFLENIYNEKLEVLPKGLYARMSKGASQILINITWKKQNPCYFSLNQLCDTIGIKWRNVTDRQIVCEKCLKELKERHCIKDWDRKNKGRKTVYTIIQVGRDKMPREI